MMVPTLPLMFGSRHYYFCLWSNRDNEPLAAPQLNVVAVNHTLRLCYGLRVVVTDQRLKAYEVAVEVNGISSVLGHLGLLQGLQLTGKQLGYFRR